MEFSFMDRDLWVSPNGVCYDGLAHAVCAKKILKDVLGVDPGKTLGHAENVLIKLGWIKLTTSAMFIYYCEDGMYDYLTPEQEQVFIDWAEYHNMPMGRQSSWQNNGLLIRTSQVQVLHGPPEVFNQVQLLQTK